MAHNSKKDYNGPYMTDDGIGAGHLHIAGKDTALKLVGKEPWKEIWKGICDYHGSLSDGMKASLLGCIPMEQTNHGWDENARYELNLFPHYILIGETHINSHDAVVGALHYHFENVHCLVNGFGTFGSCYPEREEFREILKADHERHEQVAKKNGWPLQPFDPEIGERPILLYYNGQYEIAKCSSQIGSVTLVNRVSHGLGSSRGVGINNEITASLRFISPKTVDDAIKALCTLHDFFELCLGRRQRLLRIEAELATDKLEQDDRSPARFEVIWSLCNERVSGETQRTSYGDILLDPDAQKSEFAKVLGGWLDSAAAMGESRGRFASTFHAGHYGIDRIVGAANMYDLLPESHAPARIEPDEQIKEAVRECRKRFKELPDSFARQSVLSALGRVGTASLRDKVCHRADVVIATDPERFSELHLPCTQAVLCRNHYVHGSPASFDYREEFDSFAFLTDTLEFVFAASDLIELGWDYEFWRSKGSSLTHDFGAYVVNFKNNLRELKGALSI